ncbi:MAG: YcfL family protein [Planctomycetes bacterium]|nr:YcfL family protein [Planctomycetota bacterium]
MNRLISALLFSLWIPLAACSSTKADYGPLKGDTGVIGKVRDLELRDPIIRYDNSGLAVYQITAINEDDKTLWIEWRPRWFDLEGFEVNSPANAWQRVNIVPRGFTPLKSIAPSVLAAICRIEIRKAREGLRS